MQQSKIAALERQLAALQRDYMRLRTARDRRPPTLKNSRQYWSEMIAWATVDGTAVANTTTEAILFPNVTVPANYMQDGRVLRLESHGRWGNVVTSVPTMTWAVRWGGVGGTVLATTGAIVTPAAATTAAIWSMKVKITTRSNGSTGTLFVVMEVAMGTSTVATFGTVAQYGLVQFGGSAGVATPAAVTADLTADTALSVTLDWSAANAANTATGHMHTVESLN